MYLPPALKYKAFTKCIAPPYLQLNDKVALVAPAKSIRQDLLTNADLLLRSWGLCPVLGPHLSAIHHSLAGTDQERAADLQAAINDPEITAIFCVRGGYGCIRLLEYVDFSPLLKHPKWLIGFSDITVFHTLLNCHLGVETVHACMPINYPKLPDQHSDQSTIALRQFLFGDPPILQFPNHPLQHKGYAKGKLVGGNLSILQSIAGTPFDLIPDGAILFIEDVGEYTYAIDRMMMNLKWSGKLDRIAGMIVGGFTEIKDTDPSFGYTAYQIISQITQDLDIPVCFSFPAGHQTLNLPLCMGRELELNINY